jgi:hypothetical protein
MLRLKKRHDVWMLADVEVTAEFFSGAHDFVHRLKFSRVLNSRQYINWIETDILKDNNHPFLLIPPGFGRNDRWVALFKRKTVTWLSFIQSQDVYAYYDNQEQIVLRSNKCFHDQDEVDCGNFSLTFIGKRSRRIEADGVRWSTLEDSYFGGGPSLLNHACKRHANVFIEYDNGIVIAMKEIKPHDVLRANYEEDSEVLRTTRGVICHECIK